MRSGGLLLLALLCSCGSSRSDGGGVPDAGGGLGSGGTSPRADSGDAGERLEPDAGAGGRSASSGGSAVPGGGQPESAGASGDGRAPSGAGAAGGETCDPAEALEPGPVHGLALSGLAFFQSVKVPVMEQMLEVTQRRAQVVGGRAGLLRAFVAPATGWQVRSVRARLTLTSSTVARGVPQFFEQTQTVTTASTDAELGSTFNWQVPAELLTEDLTYSVELFETKACAGTGEAVADARFPVQGEQLLGVHATTKLRIEIVPVELEIGQISLLPDVSAPQLAAFRSKVISLFPITDVELDVRSEALHTTSTSLPDILDQVAALRDEENVDPNLSYFGVVRFTDSISQYCNPSCVLGASITGTTPTGGVGVGIGYSGDKAALTFAHELGHVYGRTHAPCGVAGDPSYPYAGGRIGSWGYDVAANALFDPTEYADFMGYCSPTWVSDYTYEHLREFIAAMAVPAKMQVVPASAASLPAISLHTRSLLLQSGQAPRWGLSRAMRGAPPGVAERAIVYDANGALAGSITVHRAHASDAGLELVYIPEPLAVGWASIQLNGEAPVRLPRL